MLRRIGWEEEEDEDEDEDEDVEDKRERGVGGAHPSGPVL